MQENSSSHFQLDPTEDYFATDDQLDASKRFGLLRLRNQCTLQTLPSRPIPLHESEISQDMIEVGFSCFIYFHFIFGGIAGTVSLGKTLSLGLALVVHGHGILNLVCVCVCM